jgi:hypothetical protein
MAAISPDDTHDGTAQAQLPARPLGSVASEESIAELAATGGALVSAIIAQRWNEASRSWLQRRIGATPPRRVREEMTVRVGALLGGALTYLLAVGATEGLYRLHDRKRQREVARSVCRILAVAATAPDGSMPDEANFVVETALMGMGVGAKTRKRLLAEPRPARMRHSGRRLLCCAGWGWLGRRRRRRREKFWMITTPPTWSFQILQRSCGRRRHNARAGFVLRSPGWSQSARPSTSATRAR